MVAKRRPLILRALGPRESKSCDQLALHESPLWLIEFANDNSPKVRRSLPPHYRSADTARPDAPALSRPPTLRRARQSCSLTPLSSPSPRTTRECGGGHRGV